MFSCVVQFCFFSINPQFSEKKHSVATEGGHLTNDWFKKYGEMKQIVK